MTGCSIFSTVLTRLRTSIGVTCSYSSRLFLCALGLGMKLPYPLRWSFVVPSIIHLYTLTDMHTLYNFTTTHIVYPLKHVMVYTHTYMKNHVSLLISTSRNTNCGGHVSQYQARTHPDMSPHTHSLTHKHTPGL